MKFSMCVCLCIRIYVCLYVCMCINVVRSTFMTKYNKLQLCRPAARIETNLHTIFSWGHIMEYKIVGWKHH